MHPAKLPIDAQAIGPVDRDQTIRVTVALNTDDPAVVARVAGRFSAQLGVGVTVSDERYLHISASAGALSSLFSVRLMSYGLPDGTTFRHHDEPVAVPAEDAPHVTAVLGLSTAFRAKSHHRVLEQEGRHWFSGSATPFSGYTPLQVAKFYDFPTGDGSGQTVGLIELGGGFDAANLSAYAKSLGLPAPKVTAVSVDGTQNIPDGDPEGADGEVMLDVEVVMAVAPGAAIRVYFAPNSDQGFLDAIARATSDKCSVISISWGGPESSWSTSAMTAFDQAFQKANVLGITTFVASGDDGSSDGAKGINVDFPASSPNVTACGGTAITTSSGKITGEVVWDDLNLGGGASGGGVSAVFARPSWQTRDHVAYAKRCVPDISGNAAPGSGYRILIDGQYAVIGGTSAVAPLYAGLMAVVNQDLKVAGFGALNPTLYFMNPSAYVDVTSGNNGHWKAAKGYDLCTGLGRFDGAQFLKQLPWAIKHLPS